MALFEQIKGREAMAERLDNVLDMDKGETRLAAIREALDALIKKREAAKRKPTK